MDHNPYLNKLMNEQEGYLMKIPINGAEVTCIEKFVEYWKKHGFEIVQKNEVGLMQDRENLPETNLTFTDQAVKLVKIVAERNISNTQSMETLIVEKDGKRLIALQNWWRESSEMLWREEKGFYFNTIDARHAVNDLKGSMVVGERGGKG